MPLDAAAREDLRGALLGLGFDDVRFARVEGEAPGASALRRWLAEGRQADMAWIARNADRRADPRVVVPGALSVVSLGVNYHVSPASFPVRGASSDQDVADSLPEVVRSTTPVPRVARYAWFEDYHDTLAPGLEAATALLRARLELPEAGLRAYVDTGPLLERSWAAEAGLGFVGRNAMLISRDFGNWLFLGGVIVAAEIPPDEPLAGVRAKPGPGSLCGKCTRCLEVCPTKALTGPGHVDARLCISYLTIENKGPIPEALRPLVGDWLYGCDLCAEVCPWNRFAVNSRQLREGGLLKPRLEQAGLRLEELLGLDQAGFAALFRRTPIKRIKRAGLLRNACVVAGNSGDKSLVPALKRLCGDDSPLVQEHAAWALARLGGA